MWNAKRRTCGSLYRHQFGGAGDQRPVERDVHLWTGRGAQTGSDGRSGGDAYRTDVGSCVLRGGRADQQGHALRHEGDFGPSRAAHQGFLSLLHSRAAERRELDSRLFHVLHDSRTPGIRRGGRTVGGGGGVDDSEPLYGGLHELRTGGCRHHRTGIRRGEAGRGQTRRKTRCHSLRGPRRDNRTGHASVTAPASQRLPADGHGAGLPAVYVADFLLLRDWTEPQHGNHYRRLPRRRRYKIRHVVRYRQYVVRRGSHWLFQRVHSTPSRESAVCDIMSG